MQKDGVILHAMKGTISLVNFELHDFTHSLGKLQPKFKKYILHWFKLKPDEEMDEYFLMDEVKNAAGGKVALQWKGFPRIPLRPVLTAYENYFSLSSSFLCFIVCRFCTSKR